MNVTVAAGIGVALILLALIFRWKRRTYGKVKAMKHKYAGCPKHQSYQEKQVQSHSVHLVHRLCPHNNVMQAVAVEQKDSLDDHLDVLTRKLAEKEGRLRLSKSKIRETQNEIENLHAIDHSVRQKYREIMESLRNDLLTNERDCKKLQEQIEWVSRRRAELKEEVRRGHRLYGEAAAELAANLADLQRGRAETRVTDKPYQVCLGSARLRKEPQLPRATPLGSLAIKSPPAMRAVSAVQH